MSYDPSVDIDIIRTNLLGEDVRDAIIRLFEAVDEASIGVTITKAQYDALTSEEKANGTLYFVSDVSVADGDSLYVGEIGTEETHMLLSMETALDIVKAVRELTAFDGNILFSDIPTLISGLEMVNDRSWHILSACYNYNKNWNYSNSETKPYTIDIYPVTADHKYWLGPGKNKGNVFYATFFTSDPTTYTGNVTNGTNITYTSNVTSFNVYTFTPFVDGYIAITSSNQTDDDVETFLIDTEKINRITKVSYNKDYFPPEDDDGGIVEEEP